MLNINNERIYFKFSTNIRNEFSDKNIIIYVNMHNSIDSQILFNSISYMINNYSCLDKIITKIPINILKQFNSQEFVKIKNIIHELSLNRQHIIILLPTMAKFDIKIQHEILDRLINVFLKIRSQVELNSNIVLNVIIAMKYNVKYHLRRLYKFIRCYNKNKDLYDYCTNLSVIDEINFKFNKLYLNMLTLKNVAYKYNYNISINKLSRSKPNIYYYCMFKTIFEYLDINSDHNLLQINNELDLEIYN